MADHSKLKINLRQYKNIVILTGAGVSVASGIRPFRGKDGLWNEKESLRLSSIETLKAEPFLVWQFWMGMRRTILASQPNPAHSILAEIEANLRPDQRFILATQNIDGLHQKAGSRNVVELHGSVLRSRCSNDACTFAPFEDTCVSEKLSRCPDCGSDLRPDIVLFGESLPLKAMWEMKKALRDCDLFIAIGTSGTVSPAADFVRGAEYAGARTIYLNLDPMTPPNPYFNEVVLGRAEDVLPTLFQ
jgi:NAD-dependent deacetylase